jgi:hypothetical protein
MMVFQFQTLCTANYVDVTAPPPMNIACLLTPSLFRIVGFTFFSFTRSRGRRREQSRRMYPPRCSAAGCNSKGKL